MKIVGIDGHMIGDRSGGNESYYTNILQNMDFSGTDIHPILFLRKGVDDKAYKGVFEIVRFESDNAFVRNFIELPKLCKKYKLDLLHTQYFIPFSRPCPVVCTIHDICFEHFKDIFTKKEYFRQKLLIPYAAKHAKYIFTVSTHAKNDIVSHYHVSQDKVIVTYNAVNKNFRKLTDKELQEEELRSKFHIGNSVYVLTVGNLQPRKNLPKLIRAFVAYKKKHPDDIKLVIVGKKAWMFSDILKEACQNNRDIIFTDYVTNTDLIRLYNAARCFVYPSFFEGFGIPPLEAMACGTPVAVSNKTSLPEVVGDAGLYFDPFKENEIEECIESMIDRKKDENLEKIMKEQVLKFSWKESVCKIMEIYSRFS